MSQVKGLINDPIRLLLSALIILDLIALLDLKNTIPDETAPTSNVQSPATPISPLLAVSTIAARLAQKAR